MGLKTNIYTILNDVENLNNQIALLNAMLSEKKQIIQKYFDKTGQRTIANDAITVFTQERFKTVYDADKIYKIVPKAIEPEFEIVDAKMLSKLVKSNPEFRKCFKISKKVNEQKLADMLESGKVSVDDLEGCYTASVTKTLAIRKK